MKELSESDLIDLEWLSRSGDRRKVIDRLKMINVSQVKRPLRLKLANIARRNHQLLMAIRVLNPVVRQEKLLDQPASDLEKAEYAAALLNYGAIGEAEDLLMGIDSNKTAESLLYLAFCRFGKWDYEKAIAPLNQYIDAMKTSDRYQLLVGQVNLMAALIFSGEFNQALMALDHLIRECREQGHLLLEGNCWELSAQAYLGLNQFSKAKRSIEKANECLGRTDDLNNFYVKKWQVILDVHASPNPKSEIHQLVQLKKKARAAQHWETLRECDFYISIFSKDKSLFKRVYFGTPYESYRQMMFNKWRVDLNVNDSFIYNEQKRHKLVIRSGKFKGQQVFARGELLLRLLNFLFSDFYAPKRIAAIFSHLFTGEYFDPVSSPTRIYQLVKRLNESLRESKVPISVYNSGGAYFSDLPKTISIDFGGIEESSLEQVYFNKLLDSGENQFKSKQLESLLQCSRATVTRFLRWAIEQKLVEKHGRGPSQFYRLTS